MKTTQLTTATPEWGAGPPKSLLPEERRPRKNRHIRLRKEGEENLKTQAEASASLDASSDEYAWFYDEPLVEDAACRDDDALPGGEVRPGDGPLEGDEPWLDDKSLEGDEVYLDEDILEGDEAWYADDSLEKDEGLALTRCDDRERTKEETQPYWFEDYEFDEDMETSYARRPRGL
ncbi:hypothetical protein DL769_009199 [Monosporascus sp. CRB-8-3]|nr:hypothetical protein DL769_009199 [Monosporascus sp. CRB-8-3]